MIKIFEGGASGVQDVLGDDPEMLAGKTIETVLYREAEPSGYVPVLALRFTDGSEAKISYWSDGEAGTLQLEIAPEVVYE